MVMMMMIIIIIIIILIIYCNNDFTGKYWNVVGPKLSGTLEGVAYRRTIVYKNNYFVYFEWFRILCINHMTTVLIITNTQQYFDVVLLQSVLQHVSATFVATFGKL
jgi:hypothetical protein